MSIEVRIPKEITEYKEKILFGLSLRQLLFFILAIIVCGASYFIMTMALNWNKDMVGYIVMIEVVPLLAFGFVRKNGLPFEKYASMMIRHKTGILKRPYKTDLQINRIKNGKEKDGKYDWIFKKENEFTNSAIDKSAGKNGISADERKRDRKRREYETITVEHTD